ncbi:MAG TPA: NAD(P)H-binding protein [Candidatus Hydrogenedentes bacterium]|nr:NAD(P)H-binding protein [Candidatus Hydrogenedentota bacterium]
MVADKRIHAATGAFGYSGKYIAQRLLDEGLEVITLTNSPHKPDPFDGKVRVCPFNFDSPEALVDSLRGVAVLYNTYWVRFKHKHFTFAKALENTLALFRAAREAGVERIVHISITNPSEDSPLEYFRGKARVEKALTESGLSYAILRPTVLFGKEDVLINNIAWGLRRMPFFTVFGNGKYRLQPIYVDDVAELAVAQGRQSENTVIEAIGPETFTYRGLVETISEIIAKKRPIIPVPPLLGYLGARVTGITLGDVLLTWDEVKGLMNENLYVDAPPAGHTKLTDWIREHAATLGKRYASELARRKKK